MASRKAAPKKTGAPKAAGTKKRRGVSLRPTALGATELADPGPSPLLDELAARVQADGGAVLARYREPLGGNGLLLVTLPLARVLPTPFQRDVSDAHVRKLTRAMDKTRRFLDPIVVTATDGAYWTPNGNHRLTRCASSARRRS